MSLIRPKRLQTEPLLTFIALEETPSFCSLFQLKKIEERKKETFIFTQKQERKI